MPKRTGRSLDNLRGYSENRRACLAAHRAYLAPDRKQPVVICFDLETLNLKADLSPILSCAWKYRGQDRTYCLGLWDYPTFRKKPFDDRLLCEDLFEVFSGADVLVAHFGAGFDVRFLKSRFLYHHLGYLQPVKLVDTWQIARRNLLLTSNRLKNLGKFLRLKEQKAESGGWETWWGVVNRDPRCIRRIKRYNQQDVRALEALFEELTPWIPGMPNYHVASGKEARCCSSCGSPHLQRRGIQVTTTAIWNRFQCQSCGTWMREVGTTRGNPSVRTIT
jgi:uncharacterized protein YprB with RNaseH-like and TPR domain